MCFLVGTAIAFFSHQQSGCWIGCSEYKIPKKKQKIKTDSGWVVGGLWVDSWTLSELANCPPISMCTLIKIITSKKKKLIVSGWVLRAPYPTYQLTTNRLITPTNQPPSPRTTYLAYRIVSYRVSFRIVFASSRIVFVSFLTCVHCVRLRIWFFSRFFFKQTPFKNRDFGVF